MEHSVNPNHMFIGIEVMRDEHGEISDSWKVPIEASNIHTAQKLLNEDADYWKDPISGKPLIAWEVRKANVDEWINLASEMHIIANQEM